MARLGWIGLGDIGAPMMARLIGAGHDVIVWSRSGRGREEAARGGATFAATPADLARQADTVFLCVTDGPAVEAVVFGPDGVAAGAGPATLVVDHSTIAPGETRDFAGRLATERGSAWVDAPVSGGSAGARNGSLTVMAGGSADAVARLRPLAEAYCGVFTHVGPVGAGQVSKACNQLISNATIEAWREAIGIAERAGLQAATIAEALAGGFADSAVRRSMVPRLLTGDMQPHYVTLAAKDLAIAAAVAGPDAPLAALVASRADARARASPKHNTDD